MLCVVVRFMGLKSGCRAAAVCTRHVLNETGLPPMTAPVVTNDITSDIQATKDGLGSALPRNEAHWELTIDTK